MVLQRCFLVLCLLWFTLRANGVRAQFAPRHDVASSTAIRKDSSIIVAWASGCTLNLGWQDVANQGLGRVSYGRDTSAIGPNDDVVSLGDAGSATLTFASPITNGPGPDFAVFENGFATVGGDLLELAFVEVSSDGQHFVRFPAQSLTSTTTQLGTFGLIDDVTKLHNLAGKYIGGHGTPFDLSELPPDPMLNPNAITHVRVIDVVGSLDANIGTRDANNRLINDPYPTPFNTGGFDLDGVAVLHQLTTSQGLAVKQTSLSAWPMPQTPGHPVRISGLTIGSRYSLINGVGQVLLSFEATEKSQLVTFEESRSFSGICWLVCTSCNSEGQVLKLFYR